MREEQENRGLEQQIAQALKDVLASAPFRNSAQLQAFLRYLVEHSVVGEDNLLRERVIGAAVFGRSPGYDTSDDPIVRIRAAELRKRLALVYQNPEFSSVIRLHIPLGSYKVQMDPPWLPESAAPALEAGQAAVSNHSDSTYSKPSTPPSSLVLQSKRRVWWAAAVFATLLLAAVLYLVQPSSTSHAFWSPFTRSGKATLVVIGSNAVYRFSDEVTDHYAVQHGLQSQGMEFFMNFEPDSKIAARDLHAANMSFVAVGDVQAVSVLVARLTQEGGNFENRFPHDVSFAEVRKTPAILVGGFNNPLTMELTRNLRFVMADRNHIVDRAKPGEEWTIFPSNDAHDNTEDYAIVTRLIGGDGQTPLLIAAGMGQYGTIAAAEFAASPSSLEELNRVAARGWQKHNLQVVLHVRVADFKNTRTEIAAVHVW